MVRVFFLAPPALPEHFYVRGAAAGAVSKVPLPRGEEGMPSGSAPGGREPGAGCARFVWGCGSCARTGAAVSPALVAGVAVAGAVTFLLPPTDGAVAFVVLLKGAVAFLLPPTDGAVAFVVPLAGWGRGAFVSRAGVVALCTPSAGTTVCRVPLALGGRGASCAGGQALTVVFPQRVAKS